MKLKYQYHIEIHYLLDDEEQVKVARFGARTASQAKYKFERELKWFEEERGASIVKAVIYKDVTAEVLGVEESSITEEL